MYVHVQTLSQVREDLRLWDSQTYPFRFSIKYPGFLGSSRYQGRIPDTLILHEKSYYSISSFTRSKEDHGTSGMCEYWDSQTFVGNTGHEWCLLLSRVMAWLFCWHTQHRSLIGFIIIILGSGSSCHHR